MLISLREDKKEYNTKEIQNDENTEVKEVIKKNKELLFSEFGSLITNEDVTDIEWDGYNLWVTDLKKGCYRSLSGLDDEYINNMALRLANIMKVPFNRSHPVLEANTEDLRISIWHESRCGKKSVAIRKIPKRLRFNHETLVKSNYVSEELLLFLEKCVRNHRNFVIGGQPHAGKTELLKYLSTFIPSNEKVGVYEDNQEIHYHSVCPENKCVEFFVDEKYSYSQIIKAGLRHNIDWTLLSESRGAEVLDLLNSLSTGAHCMTTMHLDDVRDIPDRMYNMLGSAEVTDRFINSIYKYIDIGILVECDKFEKRTVSQVCFFKRDNSKNVCEMIYDIREKGNIKIPYELM